MAWNVVSNFLYLFYHATYSILQVYIYFQRSQLLMCGKMFAPMKRPKSIRCSQFSCILVIFEDIQRYLYRRYPKNSFNSICWQIHFHRRNSHKFHKHSRHHFTLCSVKEASHVMPLKIMLQDTVILVNVNNLIATCYLLCLQCGRVPINGSCTINNKM